LLGRVALVTASRRLGGAIALGLAEAGADVAVVSHRRPREGDELVARIGSMGRRAFGITADLSSASGCDAVVEQAAVALGRLDILVNVASRYVRRPARSTDTTSLAADLAVDLHAAFHCVRAAVPRMRAGGYGRIVSLTDWVAASRQPRYPGFLGYYVAKAALVALTESLALELSEDGILVNAVAPGPMLPVEGSSEDFERRTLAATPLGRWGGGEEVARAVVSLVCSDFVTGETLRVDGGRHVAR
jgi:NAD(P)-dependent dehydrogenase (short-subunit alcohol dehydrogenase family)